MNFIEELIKLSDRAMADVQNQFRIIEKTSEKNTHKVLSAFQKHRVSDSCFAGTTGYGYNDKGRDTMDLLFADIFGAEAALVRPSFANGTHAITNALFASVVPGQTLLSVAGEPYDTLHGVIGITGKYAGSLKHYGINYKQVELLENGTPDFEAIEAAASESDVGAVLIQRSRGYSPRPALLVDTIGKICDVVKSCNEKINIVVDNCYGEFTEDKEPCQVGADLIAGSMIKNPGGGLNTNGGYVAGREDLVEAASYRLTAPGIGGESGAFPFGYRFLYQGLLMSPHTVAEALKTAVFCARLLELMGYKTFPKYDDCRSDIVQVAQFGDEKTLTSFCRGIQKGAPIDSFVTPEPSEMPGYDSRVIMAAGTFTQGSTLELTSDGPIREPYYAFIQGGLTFQAGKLGIMTAAQNLLK